jgi:FkbM family methyltransferase
MKRKLINALDRPGGRKLLSMITSAQARSRTKADVTVWHDGEHWVHRTNGYSFPDGRSFPYYSNTHDDWKGEPGVYLQNAETYWYKLYRPQSGDIVIDVGAGRGEDALAFSQAVGQEGRVIAIEAHPFSFELLKKFCSLNKLSNVVPVHAAAADKAGVVYIQDSADGEWRRDSVVRDVTGSSHQVPSRSLDELCREFGISNVSFLKMNIEGAERLALPGAAGILRRTQYVCICCHDFRSDRGDDDNFRTRQFTEGFLERNGFELRKFSYRYDFERDHVYGIRRP